MILLIKNIPSELTMGKAEPLMSAVPLHKTLWQDNQALAEECLAHPFVRGLGDGSLDPEVFKHYVPQDAFFLEAFFSAYALGAVRAVERRQVVTEDSDAAGIELWFPDCEPGGELVEESVGLGRYGRILTILSTTELPDFEDAY